MTQKFREVRRWSAESIHKVCANHGLYTRGSCEEYENILYRAEELYPDTENIQLVAENIVAHSEDQTVSNVMYILMREAVFITFVIAQ